MTTQVRRWRRALERARGTLWPNLDKEETTNPSAPFALYAAAAARVQHLPSDVLDELLQQASSLFRQEADRQKSSEDRAGTLISAAGVIGSLLIGAGALLTAQDGWTWRDILVGLMYAIPLAYLSFCTAMALEVQRSKTRHTLGPDELVPGAEATLDELRRSLVMTLLHHVSENYKVNNRQMMTLSRAQVFFRNSVVSAILTGMVAVVLATPVNSATLAPTPSPTPISRSEPPLVEEAGESQHCATASGAQSAAARLTAKRPGTSLETVPAQLS